MSFSIENRIQFSETAEDGRISIGHMIDYFQNCAILQSEMLGGGLQLREKRGRAWLLNSWSIRIRERGYFADEIRVSTWPTRFNSIFGYRCFTMERKGQEERPLVEGASEWFLFDTEQEKVARITEEDTNIYECEPPLDWVEKSIRIRRAAEYEGQPAFQVQRYQLDFNGHVNNAWYVKLALEYIPPQSDVETLRVVYKRAAKYGETVYPFVAKEENRIVVDLRNEENQSYAIIEFGERTDRP